MNTAYCLQIKIYTNSFLKIPYRTKNYWLSTIVWNYMIFPTMDWPWQNDSMAKFVIMCCNWWMKSMMFFQGWLITYATFCSDSLTKLAIFCSEWSDLWYNKQTKYKNSHHRSTIYLKNIVYYRVLFSAYVACS